MQSIKANQKTIVIIVTIAIILALGAGFLVWKNKKSVVQQQVQNQEQQENEQKKEKQEVIDTSDWKTYRNEKYGYSFQYPNNWFVKTQHSNDDFSVRGGGDVMGGDTLISNYTNPSTYNLGNVPKDIFVITLLVYRIDPTTGYEDFITQQNYEFNEKAKKREIEINKVKVVELEIVSDDHPAGLNTVITLIQKDDEMFVLNYNYSVNVRIPDKIDIADKIINSLKF
jgi:uncharacterized protein YxeA